LCVWTAGVRTSGFVEALNVRKARTRIPVDAKLNVRERGCRNLFFTGDSAHFTDRKTEKALRMAVMFSMGQGRVAAENILRDIQGRRPLEYHPVDLGYLVPMAHGKAPGKVLGLNVRGFPGYAMHYAMCVYRSYRRNRPGIIKDLLSRVVV